MKNVLIFNQYCGSFLLCFKIPHPSKRLTHASFSPFSFFLSPPLMLASSFFFPLRLFTSSETLVKDNIYRKPPIYKQHGTVSSLLTSSGLVSARCVACRLPSAPRDYPCSSISPSVESMELHA